MILINRETCRRCARCINTKRISERGRTVNRREMLDAGLTWHALIHGNHVQTPRPGLPPSFAQVRLCGRHHMTKFGRCNRGLRRPVFGRPTRFYLDEHQRIPFPTDQVDFTDRRAMLHFDDGKPFAFEKRGGKLFTGIAEEATFVGHRGLV